MKKLCTIGLCALAGLLLLALVVCVGGLAVLYSESARDWVLAKARQELQDQAGLTLSIGRAEGRLPVRLSLHQVRLSKGQRELFSAKQITLAPSLPLILTGRAGVGLLRLESPKLVLPFPESGQDDSGGAALPVALIIKRLEIKNGQVLPNGEWGPVNKLEKVDLAGRLRLGRKGLSFEAQELAASAYLDKSPHPARLKGKARLTSPDHLEVDELLLSLGRNQARLTGSLDWAKELAFRAKAKGRLAEPSALPFAWPGPHPPRAEMEFSFQFSGTPADCALQSVLSLGGQSLALTANMDLTKLAGSLNAQVKGFNPRTWGLWDRELFLTGKAGADFGGPPDDPNTPVRLSLDFSGAELPGVIQGELRAEASLFKRRLDLAWLKASGAWGEVRGSGHYSYACGACRDQIKAELDFKDLTPPPGLAAKLPKLLRRPRLNGKLLAQGTPQKLQLELSLADSELIPGGLIDSLQAKGLLADSRPVLNSLNLSAAGASLNAEGRADLKQCDLLFDLDLASLEPLVKMLTPVLPALAGLQGRELAANGRLAGAWRAPSLKLNLTATELSGFERRLGDLRLAAHLERLGLAPLGWVELAAGVVESGDVKWERLQAHAGLERKGARLEASTWGKGWKSELGISTGTLDLKKFTASLTKLRLTPPGQKPWTLGSRAVVQRDESKFVLRDFALVNGKQRISAQGQLSLKTGGVELSLETKNFKLAPWLAEAKAFPKAALNLKAGLQGRLSDPVISLQGKLSGLALPKLPVMALELSGDYAKGKLSCDGKVSTASRRLFSLKADLDLNLSLEPPRFLPRRNGTVDVRLSGRELPLSLFQPLLAGVSNIQGKLNASFRAQGPWRAAALAGRAEIADGGWVVDYTGQRFRGLNALFQMRGRKVKVKRFSLKSRGELKLSGQAILPLRGPGLLDLHLAGDNFFVSLGPYGRARIKTAISLSGDFDKPVLEGTVLPEKVRVTFKKQPSPDMDDVVVLKPGQKPPPIRKDKGPKTYNPKGFLGKAKLDVKLDLAQGIKLEASQGWLMVSGGAEVYKEPFKPLRYRGKIVLGNGLIMISGKRLFIEGGAIDFKDKDVPDPSLNAQAIYKANAATVFITIAGTAHDPNLQLSSQPPMSRADILSTIIFGKPANSLSEDQNNQFRAEALALLGQEGVRIMRSVVGSTLAPDVVTVHNQDSGSSALEAGKYLSPDLYLRYRQDLGEEGGRNVGLEYRLRPWLSLESQVGTTRDTGVDVIFNLDF